MKEQSTLKTIMNKLSENKTELATHRIELSLVDDYNDRIDKANNLRKKAASSLARLEGDINGVVIQLELAEKESKKIDEIVSELGVKSPINSSKLVSKLKEFRKVESAIKSLKITYD